MIRSTVILAATTLLVGAVLASCTSDPGEVCDSTNRDGQLTAFQFTISADSQPVFDWVPDECGTSYLELYKLTAGGVNCVIADAGSCGQHFTTMWRIGTGSLPLSNQFGPATLVPPIIYGSAPASAAVEVAPDILHLGDTVMLYVARPIQGSRVTPPYAYLTFIVGVGAVHD